VDQVNQQVSELSRGGIAGDDQIEMRQQQHEQMDRLGNVLELLLTRYPMPPQAG
jgi:hypothetical protein